MFRIIIGALAIFGLFTLFTSAGAGAAIGIGVVALFFLKMLFLFALFGFFMRGAARRRWTQEGDWPDWKRSTAQWQRSWRDRQHRGRPGRSRQGDRGGSQRERQDRFDEWHDLAHAKEEVDSWTDDL